MFSRMTTFFETIFSRCQGDFGKGFSTQQCLLAIFVKWKRSVDNGKTFGL